MEVVKEGTFERAWPKGKYARYLANVVGVEGGVIDGAIDHVRGDPVHPRDQCVGLSFFFTLSFFGFQDVDYHGINGLEPFAVQGLSVGKPRNESFGRLRSGDVYAHGSTCVRLIIAGPIFSGGGPCFDVFKGGVAFNFGEPLGSWPPRLDRVPRVLE